MRTDKSLYLQITIATKAHENCWSVEKALVFVHLEKMKQILRKKYNQENRIAMNHSITQNEQAFQNLFFSMNLSTIFGVHSKSIDLFKRNQLEMSKIHLQSLQQSTLLNQRFVNLIFSSQEKIVTKSLFDYEDHFQFEVCSLSFYKKDNSNTNDQQQKNFFCSTFSFRSPSNFNEKKKKHIKIEFPLLKFIPKEDQMMKTINVPAFVSFNIKKLVDQHFQISKFSFSFPLFLFNHLSNSSLDLPFLSLVLSKNFSALAESNLIKIFENNFDVHSNFVDF